ncbi:toll/interleukin-1 receptor domain-containing protein [Clostridium perfringens]|uniref:toll/interleukin-1 receptor domain-containing protein n=1 Tax=Clostridium perfringens TaxID=1502 RepID=UPI0030CBC65E
MGKVFLSHSSSDKDKYVRKVANELINKVGISNIVYDEYTFEEGMKPIEEIENELEKSDLFVIFLSDKALNSKWVKLELKKAKEFERLGIIERIYPIIIDEGIFYTDDRIPKWMKNTYNIKLIKNPNKASIMIRRKLLQISWDNHPKIKEKDNIFVGRNDYLKSFEERFYSYDKQIVNGVVASGIKNIGRKSLINKCLRNVNAIKEDSYMMPKIILNSLESLEDFIYKIYDLGFSDLMQFKDLGKMKLESKINMALDLIDDIQKSKEIIHIEDEGGIVTHDGEIVEWFLEIINKLHLKDRVTFAITSRFKVTTPKLWKYQSIYAIEVNEFEKAETMGLLNRYLQYYDITIQPDEFKSILEILVGLPEQVEYAVYLIKHNGIKWVKKNLALIVEYNNERVIQILSDIDNDSDKIEFLRFLCSFDYIGYDFIFEVIEEDYEKYEAYLIDLVNRSICEYVGSNKEYLKVNSSIKDYILRTNINLSQKYSTKLNCVITNKLANIESQYNNVPEFLFTIKEAIMNGQEVDEKLIIPSHYLTVMNELYNKKKDFREVIKLADKALENEQYMDNTIILEIRKLLCMSLAKIRSRRFLEEVHKIDGAEHDFLMGFYYRQINKPDKALVKLLQSLKRRTNYTKARRELVQVYIRLQEYSKAKVLAEQNYNNDTSNPYHIQAYFTCIIKEEKSDKNDKILNELLSILSKIKSEIADEMLLRCKAQYMAFYLEEEEESLTLINKAIVNYPNIIYPLIVKFDICEKFNRIEDMENIVEDMKKNKYYNEYYKDSIIYYEAMCMSKRGNKDDAVQYVDRNLKNYTDEAKDRVKGRILKA